MSLNRWDLEFETSLLEAKNYRDFLRQFFVKDGPWFHPRPLSYRGFAQKAGFASPSYINDIVVGRKCASPSSFSRMVVGLSLNKIWSDYFYSLIALEESEFCTAVQGPDFHSHRVNSIKQKIFKRISSKRAKPTDPLVRTYLHPWFPEVYAALGEVGVGSDLDTIISRVRLNKTVVLSVLEQMENAGIVTRGKKQGHYLPGQLAIDADGLGGAEVFQADFMRSLRKATARLKKQCETPTSLFMTQTFSVSSRELPRLKIELAELVRSFSSDAEVATGDCVADVVIAFTNTHTESK